jgi:hypothetical protein
VKFSKSGCLVAAAALSAFAFPMSPAHASGSCTIGAGVGPGDCIFHCSVGDRVHVKFEGYFGFVTGSCPGAYAACDINPVTNGTTTTTCERYSDTTATAETYNGLCHTDGLSHVSVTCEAW